MMSVKRTFTIALMAGTILLSPLSPDAQGTQRSINEDLMYRISFGRAQDVQALLDKGAEANIYGGMGDTPIILAISRNLNDSLNIIKALLAKGADPNFPDKSGHYPLEVAIKSNKHDIVSLLIEGGADMRMKTNEGVTMVDLANQIGNPEVTRVLGEAIRKESDKEAILHDPNRLVTAIHQFTTSICEMTYWNNYLLSEQNPADNDATRDKIEKNRELSEKIGRDITLNFPKVKLDSFVKYSADSINNVFGVLNTPKLRQDNGVGQDEDAHSRCKPIADASRDSIATIVDAQKKAADEAAHQAELMR